MTCTINGTDLTSSVNHENAPNIQNKGYPMQNVNIHVLCLMNVVDATQFHHLEKTVASVILKLSQKRRRFMIIEIDFNSDEAIYVQLCNQIILGIATSQFREGEQLPSVRQLAETIGINMHTVNKAYSILQQDGFVKIDRRRGAIIAIDINKLQALQEAQSELAVVLARAICKGIGREDIHGLVDNLYDNYERNSQVADR